METNFGKLVLLQEDGPEQEFELGKAEISLGRATTNDIVLGDGRVSRNHARLEFRAAGCQVIDLGSANGTRVNGLRVDRAELEPGDILILGNSQLRYEAAQVYEEVGLTMIDTASDLDRAIDQEVLPMAINETRTPRLVVVTSGNIWEVSLKDVEEAVIGRTDENAVVIEQAKVSRRHAEVVRRGEIFVLRDLGSTNGTWHKGEKVSELVLQDGDTFRVGEAQIVFKRGFIEENLTIADTRLEIRSARKPVVFVPGFMGSELWLGNERVWPNVKYLFKNPEIVRYPSEAPLEPRGIVDEVVIVPNLVKLDQYNRLGDYLVEELGYKRGIDYFEFPYDWRQDVRQSARQLGVLIEALPTSQPVILIGHSLGTMVSRYYVERLGGSKRVERLLLMGGPHAGAVKGLTSLLVAPQMLPFGIMGERLRQVILTFATCYQILPNYAAGVDQNGKKINFLEDDTWLEEKFRPLLRGGLEFRKELSKQATIPAVSIFGYGLKTIANVRVERGPGGEYRNIEYSSEPSGDSTILQSSATLAGSEIHPVQQHHGALFVDNDVKMRLKMELMR
jgi:pSer/pThr/pTyr-binding forkhead associated (FHA) protein